MLLPTPNETPMYSCPKAYAIVLIRIIAYAMPQINLNNINDTRPHPNPYPTVETIAITDAVIVTVRTPYLANSFTTTGLNKMRINRLMDSNTPIHTTGISITSACCGKNGYKNA